MSSLARVILLGWIQISAFQQKNVQIAKYKFRAGVILCEWVYICDPFSWPYLRQRKKISHYLGLKKSYWYLTKDQSFKWLQTLLQNMHFPFWLHPLYRVALLIHEAFLFPYPKFLSFPHVPFVSILSVSPLFFLLFLLERRKGVYVYLYLRWVGQWSVIN